MSGPGRRAGGARGLAWPPAVALLSILLLLAACAPRLQPPGDRTGAVTPEIAAGRIVMDDGASLPLRRWLPAAGDPEAVILALHGFNDYSNAFAEAATGWAAEGIATYAYDQRGFGATAHRGLWPGEDRLVEDLRTAATLLRARHPGTPLYLLGESMGGAVVMAAMTSRSPPDADGIILAAPAAWSRSLQGPLQSAVLWLAAHTVPWMTLTGKGLDIWPSDNIEMLRALAADPQVIKETRVDAIYGLVDLMDRAYAAAPKITGPALVLYGRHEQVIPPDAALALLRRLPPNPPARLQIAVYPDGYHMLLRDLQAEVVRRDVLAWIADRQAPLPSGADRIAAAILAGDGEDLALSDEALRAILADRRPAGVASGGPSTVPAEPGEGIGEDGWWTAQ